MSTSGAAQIAATGLWLAANWAASFAGRPSLRNVATPGPPGMSRRSKSEASTSSSMASASRRMPCLPVAVLSASAAMVTSMPARRRTSTGVTVSISSKPSTSRQSTDFFMMILLCDWIKRGRPRGGRVAGPWWPRRVRARHPQRGFFQHSPNLGKWRAAFRASVQSSPSRRRRGVS